MATRRTTTPGRSAQRRRPEKRTGLRKRTTIKSESLPAPGGRFVGTYMEARAKVSPKGWIVIPKQIRDEMGLRPGDEVMLNLWPPSLNMKQDRGLYTLHMTRVPEDPVALFSGMFKRRPGEPSMTEQLLEERRREREREERDLPRPHRAPRKLT